MKIRITFLVFIFYQFSVLAQSTELDSIYSRLATMPNDTNKINQLLKASFVYHAKYPYFSIGLASDARKIAKELGDKLKEGKSLSALGAAYWTLKNYQKSIELLHDYIAILKQMNAPELTIARAHSNLGKLYMDINSDSVANEYILMSLKVALELNAYKLAGSNYHMLSIMFRHNGNTEQCLEYSMKSAEYMQKSGVKFDSVGAFFNKGITYKDLKMFPLAIQNLKYAKEGYSEIKRVVDASEASLLLGETYIFMNKPDSARIYYEFAYRTSTSLNLTEMYQRVYTGLAKCDSAVGNIPSAIEYYKTLLRVKDSIDHISNLERIFDLEYKNKLDNLVIENNHLKSVRKFNNYILFFVIIFSIVLAIGLIHVFKNHRKLKKVHQLLKEQQSIIEQQNCELQTQTEILEFHKDNLEHEVAERTHDLFVAKVKAEESDKLKSAFLNNVSHEIRTPLNAISGFSQLMLTDKTLQLEYREYLQTIIDNGNQLLYILGNIVDAAQIESSSQNVNQESLNLYTLCKDLNDLANTRCIAKNLEMEFEFNLSDDIQIKTDKTKLYKIIYQLLDNAIKFTNNGAILFQVGCTQENNLEILVKDSGIGIPHDLHQNIFKPFYQTDGSLSRHREGNGLGLAIVRGYVNMLGGEIKLESEVNKGSTFIVAIPDVWLS